MLTALIILTIISIAIPTIALVEWVHYVEEEDATFMASLKSRTTETTVTEDDVVENNEVVIYVRRYNNNYADRVERETEADTRMRQANLFYERGIAW